MEPRLLSGAQWQACLQNWRTASASGVCVVFWGCFRASLALLRVSADCIALGCIAGSAQVVRADPTASGDVELWELHEELLREVRQKCMLLWLQGPASRRCSSSVHWEPPRLRSVP